MFWGLVTSERQALSIFNILLVIVIFIQILVALVSRADLFDLHEIVTYFALCVPGFIARTCKTKWAVILGVVVYGIMAIIVVPIGFFMSMMSSRFVIYEVGYLIIIFGFWRAWAAAAYLQYLSRKGAE